jgi:hypothetical protein
MPEPGRLAEPYPVQRCGHVDCINDGSFDSGAYLYRDLDMDKLVVLCGDCARYAELVAPTRFVLIAL